MISIPCYANEAKNPLHTERGRPSALVMFHIHLSVVSADESSTLKTSHSFFVSFLVTLLLFVGCSPNH